MLLFHVFHDLYDKLLLSKRFRTSSHLSHLRTQKTLEQLGAAASCRVGREDVLFQMDVGSSESGFMCVSIYRISIYIYLYIY